MKKIFPLVLLLTITGHNSCETFDGQHTLKNTVYGPHSKLKDDIFYSIQNNIVNHYYLNYSNHVLNLENLIFRFDSMTINNLEFQDLKVVNYSIPISVEIVKFFNNQDYVYENLDVSFDCKYILDEIIISKNINLLETKLLHYISNSIIDGHNNLQRRKGKVILIV